MSSIHEIFKPLYTTDKRYILLTGGRASLKSSTVHDFILRLTYEIGHGILFTRYTMSSAHISIIPELKLTIDRLGISKDFDITKQIVTNKHTGSFIYFSGVKTSSGDQTAKLKSIAGITTLVVEEGEDFKDEKTFNTIDDSIRSVKVKNRIIWIQNPTTKEHFIYKKWIEKTNRQIKINGLNVTVSNHKDVEHIHTSYNIAEQLGYLSQSWLNKANYYKSLVEQKVNALKLSWSKSNEELQNEINNILHTSYYYYNYVGGWLEKADGVIFDNWIEGEFNDNLPFCYGLDYGYSPDPLALVKVAVDKKNKRIYIKQEIYETELDDIVNRLDALNIDKRSLIVCDTNEPRTTQRIRLARYNIVPAIKERINDDIREIKQYQIIVDSDSKDIKQELNNYVWNDKKASIPIGEFNHSLDAMRYAFRRLNMSKAKGVRLSN